MFRRALHRNIALLVAVVLAGQLIAGFMVMGLVVRPQVTRVANVTADMIDALSHAMEKLPPADRAMLIAGINEGGSMGVRPAADVPPDGPRFPTMVERQFIQVLAQRLTRQDQLTWRTDTDGRLWFMLRIGGDDYWVSVTPPRQGGAVVSLIMAFVVAFLVSVICGMALQRRIDQPMRRLVRSVEHYRTDGAQPPFDTDGPQEVAAVATALNGMTQRIADQEAERALMLAGVSHDLRTPLTKLRLSLELMQGHDPDLEVGAVRQVDRIETMLSQFLEFARGFQAEAPEPVDIGSLLEQVVREAGLAGRVAMEAPTAMSVTLRPRAVGRAVDNLLCNAVRHGGGPVALAVERDGPMLRIIVSDAGDGFDPAMTDMIVRPFARGDSARGGEGAGLGLAIVHRVALAHGGRLRFDRLDGRFSAILELATAQAA